MDHSITIRFPKDFVKNLSEISKIENLDTSSVVRRLLAGAIKEWRKEYAVEQYKKGEFSFGQLAKFAGISVWDVPNLLKDKKVPFNYDEEELEADLKAIKKLRSK
jgi:predicted HTH domain antitoxin